MKFLLIMLVVLVLGFAAVHWIVMPVLTYFVEMLAQAIPHPSQ